LGISEERKVPTMGWKPKSESDIMQREVYTHTSQVRGPQLQFGTLSQSIAQR
jgi:hypothetical protein